MYEIPGFKKTKSFLLWTAITLFSGCVFSDTRDTQIEPKSFYDHKAVLGKGRSIPLIKPYITTEDDNVGVWRLEVYNKKDGDLPGTSRTVSLDSLNVLDSVIVLKCRNGPFSGYSFEKADMIYHVIIPRLHIEKVFFSDDEFLSFLKKTGIRAGITFHSAYDIYDKWEKKGILPWKRPNVSDERTM